MIQDPLARRRTGRPVQLLFGVLFAIVAVAGIGYFLMEEIRTSPPGEGAETTTAPPAPDRGRRSPAPTREQADPAPGRTTTILTCTAADGQVFYTNATRCEDADLENRINVLETPELPASRPGTCLGAQAGGAELQRFLPMCREAFDAALELEPFLLELDDVSGSRALRRYCAFITEGVQAGCMATSDLFCFLPRCQELREPVQP